MNNSLCEVIRNVEIKYIENLFLITIISLFIESLFSLEPLLASLLFFVSFKPDPLVLDRSNQQHFGLIQLIFELLYACHYQVILQKEGLFKKKKEKQIFIFLTILYITLYIIIFFS